MYDHHVRLVVKHLRCTGSRCYDAKFLSSARTVYNTLLSDYSRFEIAESF
ncbi:MAG: isocitrate dehydrogenase kinase/phosphatase AceK regulatory subunit [Candidatus Malihini olakiniferum]